MSLFDKGLAAVLPHVPKPIVRRVAKRYVAGETLEEAMAVLERLAARGAMATIDVLGEEISEIGRARQARNDYLAVLEEIARRRADSNVSIKLTAFGLRLEKDACYEHVKAVVERARALGNFVRLDMEDSSTTSDTLDIYRRLRGEGYDNCGVVLQAYMRRSAADVEALAGLGPNYRLCKGIYVESEEIAFKDLDAIRANYLELLEDMLRRGSYVGIATHDHALVRGAEEIIRKLALERSAYEFQMLLGVDEALGKAIMGAGHRLRIYVPFGRDWYAYSLRRLKENPRIGRYVFLSLFRG